MSNNYVNFSSIPGPFNGTAATTLPGELPPGVLNQVFKTGGWYAGYSIPSSIFVPGSDGSAGRAAADGFGIDFTGAPSSPLLLKALLVGTAIPTVTVISTANATGGIPNEWVQCFWLLSNVRLTNLATYADQPAGQHQLQLAYEAVTYRFYNTPAGGNLGTSTATTFNFRTLVSS